MKTNHGRRKLALWLVCLMTITLFPTAAFADVPYRTFTKDSYDRTIMTQPAYAPKGVIARDIPTLNKQGEMSYTPMQRPQDLFIDRNDHIFIADTDNNRIIHLNPSGELVRIITLPESPLNQPHGVFVTEQGDIFIADTGNKRVVHTNREGRLLQEIKRPKSSFMNEQFVYEPTNMVVDQRGFIYVVSKGSYNGIIEFDPEGNFLKFFGTNKTEVNLMDKIRRQFYTKEQLSRQVRLLPVTIRNIEIDEQGFIYTVSGSKSEQVKKLNIRGEDLWKEKDIDFDKNKAYRRDSSEPIEPQLTDVSVDRNGNILMIDKSRNIISQYDGNGELLFYWSGSSTTGNSLIGLTKAPTAIATNSRNEVFILDEALNLVQVYKPTEFGSTVQAAYKFMQDGKYIEGEKYWNKVLKLNAHFSPAFQGIAQAAFYRGDYELARDMFKLAGDEDGFSDSFWQLRLGWFQKNFAMFANILIGLGVLIWIIGLLKRKYKFRILPKTTLLDHQRWYQQFKHVFYILKHPIDGFGDLRYRHKGSYISALILLVLTLVMILVKTYYSSFTFNPVPDYEKGASSMLIIFMSVWLSWVICNYLIGSIRQGEARFKDVFMGSSYALFPVVLFGLPLALISNGLTLSEASIYHAIEWAMMLWSGLLFFWNIQAMQNYGVGETVVNILLTAVTMMILWVMIFILVGLSSEFSNFIYTIYQEVSM
ncbi:YIP1 family protein [Paenibacillus guangzhouensis]|uniref:YIP1 family protein n=1 Tax=Paenibacillus guangzhouensis TaxID=1473112 RepID=UPI001266EED9|nr:YIP1 family protein [Paenibacillus guangzhouensis]